eukprot:TRINITY_DN10934_c0_g1_i2.p3 TRINITY_DN10934_c0_g1~~TRINITY_DN10934_c0_g1_i2.p3  ORF type:complete len:125 (-),score=12.36 TRINITY_DN10934_c0_g1_i2:481-855(-)
MIRSSLRCALSRFCGNPGFGRYFALVRLEFSSLRCTDTADVIACNACLTSAIDDQVKVEQCPICANSSDPQVCNHCLTQAIANDLKPVCDACSASSDNEACSLCLTSEALPEDVRGGECLATYS